MDVSLFYFPLNQRSIIFGYRVGRSSRASAEVQFAGTRKLVSGVFLIRVIEGAR
jgi:hypothetical protein